MKKKFLSGSRLAALSAVAMGLCGPFGVAGARDLVRDFDDALLFDPSYQGALAEFEVGQRTVRQARSVFFPEATFSTTRLATDTGTRSTFSVNQPIVDVERYMTREQATPRQLQAELSLLTRRQDLASRLVKAANAITLALENISLNEAKMAALDQQAQRAKRLFEGGLGTITDMRDIEVKASQARAQQLSLKTQLHNALQAYQAMTGIVPRAPEFVLPATHGGASVQPLPDAARLAVEAGPAVLAARYGLQIADYEVKKIRASFLPTMSAVYTQSKSNAGTTTNQYVGLGFSVPLKAGTVYGLNAAEAGVVRAQEAVREAESRVRLDADRLSALVASGVETLRIQKDAIAAAELSVEANTMSYQGGVRSAVDVLNAIQTVYQVKSEYAQMATSQAENILALSLLAATDPRQAVQQARSYLFDKL
jgi:outer membrane protein TolC